MSTLQQTLDKILAIPGRISATFGMTDQATAVTALTQLSFVTVKQGRMLIPDNVFSAVIGNTEGGVWVIIGGALTLSQGVEVLETLSRSGGHLYTAINGPTVFDIAPNVPPEKRQEDFNVLLGAWRGSTVPKKPWWKFW